MLRSMIERHYGQRQIAEGFFNAPIEDWWEPWMKRADEILDDEELIDTVYEALRRRHPQSATRGRMGTPAEIVIRLMVLKHVRGWSYETLEREVRANMVYRMFTRIGAEKVPGSEDHGPTGSSAGSRRRRTGSCPDCWNRTRKEDCSWAKAPSGHDGSGNQHSLSDPIAVCLETVFEF